jgi:D-threo-aldose 1-dehydrogenase
MSDQAGSVTTSTALERDRTQRLGARPLGRTSLRVTPLGAGCSPLGSMPASYGYAVSEEQALRTLEAVLSSPINFLDTAAIYGEGESERRIAKAIQIRGSIPDGLVLATKADRDPHTGRFDADQVKRSVSESLTRLGLERLQLVYLHDPEHIGFDCAMASGGPVEALVQLHREGVIANLGVSGGPVALLRRFVETRVFAVVLTHNRFTPIDRSALPLLEVASAHDVAVVNAAPFGGGILAKGLRKHPMYGYKAVGDRLLGRIARFEALCARHHVPPAGVALQFSMRNPGICSTVVGLSRPERVEQMLQAASCPIPDIVWDEVDELGLKLGDPDGDRW